MSVETVKKATCPQTDVPVF